MEEVFGNANIVLDIEHVTENGIENFDALKEAVLNDVAVYSGVVVSDDNLEEAPKWRAELNKKEKRISDFRIAFEKDYKKKIEKSVSQLKELANIYKDASSNIDVQVKTFDDKRKQEKQDAINSIFNDVFSDMRNIIDLARVESFSDGKWLNKGTSLDSIKSFMEETRSKIDNGFAAIHGLGSKYDREMCLAFLKKLDIADALAKKSDLEQFEQQMAARKAAEDESRRRAEEARKAREEAKEQAVEEEQDTVQETAQDAVIETAKEPQFRLAFAVYGTKKELIEFSNYVKNCGLRYERL